MRLRIGRVLASIAAVLALVVAATGVMVVDVKKSDGTRLVVPMPLLLVQAAARFAPIQSAAAGIERQAARVRQYLPVAEQVLAAVGRREPGFRRGERRQRGRARAGAQGRKDPCTSASRACARTSSWKRAVRARVAGYGPGPRRTLSAADLVAVLRHSRLTRLADVPRRRRSREDHDLVTWGAATRCRRTSGRGRPARPASGARVVLPEQVPGGQCAPGRAGQSSTQSPKSACLRSRIVRSSRQTTSFRCRSSRSTRLRAGHRTRGS